MRQRTHGGFTLIELATVLVIIGLIIGGILVGQDLIHAAAIRSQISQLDRYKTAMLTFKSKYGYLPGDMPASQAAATGMIARGGGVGDGDGNGLIEGLGGDTPVLGFVPLGGETVFFWTDLSSAQLIEGSFSDSSDALINLTLPNHNAAPYLPVARIGSAGGSQGTYIYAFSAESSAALITPLPAHGAVYFGLMDIQLGDASPDFGTTVSPSDAYAIDSKVDDGMPLSGAVVAGNADYYSLRSHAIDALSVDASVCPNGIFGGNQCCVDSNLVYHVANTERACSVAIRAY